MTTNEQLDFLISELSHSKVMPKTVPDKWRLFRSLVNERIPKPVSNEFLTVQDKMLKSIIAEKGITDVEQLNATKDGIYLWKGDITTLKVDAIVNAANSGMLGCFCPCHACIDNAIHTFAGVQLRLECAEIMKAQGHSEFPSRRGLPTGKAKITNAYNLPSKYILHTVGPIISGRLTQKDRNLLANCYRSCLNIAQERGLASIAFCCISTGEFHFPNDIAAEIAVKTITDFRKQNNEMKTIFNVFKDIDLQIYQNLLK